MNVEYNGNITYDGLSWQPGTGAKDVRFKSTTLNSTTVPQGI